MKRIYLISRGAIVLTLLFTSLPAFAQTFFGGGGTTNTATNATNVGLGYSTLFSNTTGSYNTAVGMLALYSNTTGGYNTANGYYALYSNTTGRNNTANGYAALKLNTTGNYNTANGNATLYSNTTGNYNTANGYAALFSNTTGSYNTANGVSALYSNTTGNYNTANGYVALRYNTTGSYNTANGYYALYSNTTGTNNTANGYATLYLNTKGSYNTADGNYALNKNTTGSSNTAHGYQALFNNVAGSSNVGVGFNTLYAVSNGTGNIALGYSAGQNLTLSDNIAIGNVGLAADSGAIRIGRAGVQTSAFIAGINGATASSGVAVYIDSNGQLGTITSSRRFKNDIKDIGSVSDRLLQLRPVTFRYKTADETGAHPMQYGLIAEEVAKVFPDLVQYDKAGKPFTVRYHLLTPMLLNELQKERAARKAEVSSLKASYDAKLNGVMAELAQQKRLLNQLAAYIQNNKKSAIPEKANFVQH